MGSSSLYPLRDGSSDWAASQATATSVRAVLASFVLHLFVVLLSLWVTSFTSFYLVLGFFSVLGSMAVLSLRGTAVFTLWRQLNFLINTTRFPLPWDIGTPRHWNPESKHRDIGTSGHWNPECTGRGKGTDPRTGKGAPTQGNGVSPRASSAVFSAAWFMGQAAHGGYDVLGRCMLLAGAVFGLFFPRLLGEVRSHSHQSELMGRELFQEQRLSSSERAQR